MSQTTNSTDALQSLLQEIRRWSAELGFQDMGVALADNQEESDRLQRWLDADFHGSMSWMAENVDKRLSPALLVDGAKRILSFRMNYLPPETQQIKILKDASKAYVSRYALGRDYHKLIRKRLATLCKKIEHYCAENALNLGLSQRPFVDSAPVLERPSAQKAGLGWVGKHSLLINQHQGSWFFLGEILTDIPFPVNTKIAENQCGDCDACLKVCPTDAFPEPYILDARRCISYLTIENKGPIPEGFRNAIGNRVFGCDDCQAICPWNKFAQTTQEDDFKPRHQLDSSELADLFQWDEPTFLDKTAGSPIRRIGYENWLRNLAVGLGNAPQSPHIDYVLASKIGETSAQVDEHIEWALQQHRNPQRVKKRKVKNPNKKIPARSTSKGE